MGAAHFPPILHVLMAKLGLNFGVANGDGRVLLLCRGYGMGCSSQGIINPLSLPTCRGPHRMGAVTDDRFQIASSTEGIRSTGRLRWPRVCVWDRATCQGPSSVVSAVVMGKKSRAETVYPRSRFPSLPIRFFFFFFFVRRKSARSPDIPLPRHPCL